jgi:hypothetical protein
MARPEDVSREAVAEINYLANSEAPVRREEIEPLVELIFEAFRARDEGKDIPDSRARTLPRSRWGSMGIN